MARPDDGYDPYARLDPVPSFTLSSDDITAGMPVPPAQRAASHGGRDASPHLSWSRFPEQTESFAVTCYDPDAPTGSGFWHWAVHDIPPEVTELASGAGGDAALLPPGARTLPNETRGLGYTGMAPPPGDGRHRYFFVVHAVDVATLDIDPTLTPAVLGFNLHFHTLARAVLVATCDADDAD